MTLDSLGFSAAENKKSGPIGDVSIVKTEYVNRPLVQELHLERRNNPILTSLQPATRWSWFENNLWHFPLHGISGLKWIELE
jgi:hypothetical protein